MALDSWPTSLTQMMLNFPEIGGEESWTAGLAVIVALVPTLLAII